MAQTHPDDHKFLNRATVLSRFHISRGTLWRLEHLRYLTAKIGRGRLSRFSADDVSRAIDAFSRSKGGVDANS